MARPRTKPLPQGIYIRNLAKGPVYYIAFQAAVGQQARELAGKDLAGAVRLRTERLRQVAEGTYTPRSGTSARPTHADLFPKWIAFLRAEGRVRTVDTVEQRGRDHMLPHLGTKHLDETRPKDVADWVRSLIVAKALAPKTIHNVHGDLSAFYAWARFQEFMLDNPAKGLPRGVLPKKTPKRKPAAWSWSDVGTFISDARIREDRRVIFAIASFTGARLGECAGMRWRDIDRKAAPLWRWMLRTQYDDQPLKLEEQPRDVPIHPLLRTMLEAWERDGFERFMCRKPTPDDFVVPMDRAGGCHTKESIGAKDVKRRAKLVDIDATGRDFHSFRRSMITTAREKSVDPDVLERVTHNSRGSILDVYTKYSWEPLCRVVLALPNPLPHHTAHHGDAGEPCFSMEAPGVEHLSEAPSSPLLADNRDLASSLDSSRLLNIFEESVGITWRVTDGHGLRDRESPVHGGARS